MQLRRLLLPGLTALLLASPAFAWLKVGNKAPEVTGITATGISLKFAEVYPKGNTLVYFFPQAGSPDCTTEACNLRDNYEAITKLGINVIGISHDAPADQLAFVAKNKLPFTLISDQDGAVAKAFAVPTNSANQPKRQSFLVNQVGVVVWCDYKTVPKDLSRNVLHTVATIRGAQGMSLDKLRAESFKDQDERNNVSAQRGRDAQPYAGNPANNPANKPGG